MSESMKHGEQTTKITSKDPRKVEAGKRLAAYNKIKREELLQTTTESRKILDERTSDNTKISYGIGALVVFAVIGAVYYYHRTSIPEGNTAATQESKQLNQPAIINKFTME